MVKEKQNRRNYFEQGWRVRMSASTTRKGLLKRLGINLPPRPTVPKTHAPSNAALSALTVAIALVAAWHFSIAHPAIAGFTFLPLLLKVIYLRRDRRSVELGRQAKHAPSRWVMAIFTVLSLGLILIFYGGWNGQVAGISFVVLLVSLKFLESRVLRDYFVVCVILLFLASCAFLFDSSILSILGVTFYVILIVTILHLLSTPGALATKPVLFSSARLIATALPLAILLFFLFPRIQGDFGFLPSRDENGNSQALEDRMIAGDLALAAFNNALAFRAEFDDVTPATHERYWRVKALTGERNFQWEIAPDTTWLQDERVIKCQGKLLSKGFYNYTIIHQESTDPYLPYLDYLRGFSDGMLLNNTVVRLRNNGADPFIYSGSADRQRNFNMSADLVDQRFLQTEALPTSRMNRQLDTWRSLANTNAELANLVLQHFRKNPFSYTLLPPILDEEFPLEDFFFRTQSGYCEHYASTFTTIMRWLQVPARVVVGYQGGELNTSGSFIEVRYSDAHAWSELWIDGRWQRYDPTAAISPDRIEFGMQALMEMWDGGQFSDQRRGRALANFLNPSGVSAAYRFMRQTWSNASYQWNKWVVNYSVDTQKELLESLGLGKFKTLSTLMVLLIIGITIIALAQLLPSWLAREPKAIEQRLFDILIKKISRKGIIIESGSTARDIAESVIQRSPTQANEIQEIVSTFESLRYASIAAEKRATLLNSLKSQISRFRLKPGKKRQTTEN